MVISEKLSSEATHHCQSCKNSSDTQLSEDGGFKSSSSYSCLTTKVSHVSPRWVILYIGLVTTITHVRLHKKGRDAGRSLEDYLCFMIIELLSYNHKSFYHLFMSLTSH